MTSEERMFWSFSGYPCITIPFLRPSLLFPLHWFWAVIQPSPIALKLTFHSLPFYSTALSWFHLFKFLLRWRNIIKVAPTRAYIIHTNRYKCPKKKWRGKKNLDPNRNNFSMLSHKNLIIPDSETFLNPII